MKCPKCHHDQVAGSECEVCGVVFEKYQRIQERLNDPIHSISDRKPVRLPVTRLPRWVRVTLSLTVVWAFITGSMYLAIRSAPMQPRPGGPTGIARQFNAVRPHGNPVQESRLATVFIETPWGSGSGFFIDSSCRILTNKHVLTVSEKEVEEIRQELRVLAHVIRSRQESKKRDTTVQRHQHDRATPALRFAELKTRLAAIEESRANPSYTVILYDDSTYTATDVTFSDTHDLALLRLDQKECPCMKKGQSGALKVGQSVFTIGNPLGLSHTVTSGIFSGKRSHEGHTYIQTDAPINPDNSGGPLIDQTGCVVGINTMILAGSEGIGLAIPIEAALNEFQELIP